MKWDIMPIITKKENRMKIIGKLPACIEIDERDLGYALMESVFEKLGLDDHFDDAGCDWLTDGSKVYIGGTDWIICDNAKVATLVDAANILKSGHKLTIDK